MNTQQSNAPSKPTARPGRQPERRRPVLSEAARQRELVAVLSSPRPADTAHVAILGYN